MACVEITNIHWELGFTEEFGRRELLEGLLGSLILVDLVGLLGFHGVVRNMSEVVRDAGKLIQRRWAQSKALLQV